MLTLVKHQISKRIKFSVAIIIGLILINTFFTGIIEISTNNSKNPYEGYDIAFGISLAVIILLHIISMKNEFYNDRGKLLFSFPVRGYSIVLSRLVILLMDVALAAFLNLFVSYLVRLVVIHNFKAPIKFLRETLGVISSSSILVVCIILMMFLFMYFAIALSETIFYQNGIAGLISTIVIFVLYGFVVTSISYLLNLFITLKLPAGIPNQGDVMFIIPVVENSYYNITNIFLVIVFMIASFIGCSKIIDKHLNL